MKKKIVGLSVFCVLVISVALNAVAVRVGGRSNAFELKKKALTLALSCVSTFAIFTIDTVAWLNSQTSTTVNTFTFGNIDIKLSETGAVNGKKTIKLNPGQKVAKDPKITVVPMSEDSYVYVKVEEKLKTGDTQNAPLFTDYIQYNIADGWTQIGNTGIYYREHNKTDAATDYYIIKGEGNGELKNGFVKCNPEVDNEDVAAVSVGGGQLPTLSFTAYAVQKGIAETATDAWLKAFAL